MENDLGFGDSVARIFLKLIGVFVVIMYLMVAFLPVFLSYALVRSLVPGDIGKMIAMAVLMATSFFFWWMSSFPRVRRSMQAAEYLIKTCLKNDQERLFS